jgi:hypothetical protein
MVAWSVAVVINLKVTGRFSAANEPADHAIRKSFACETLAPSAASIAGKIQYVRVRHPNANYVRTEHFY